ncbi:MAG: hypothetical protein WC612_03365 [Bdellovibrionales bacterium]|jgi:hypothetical protein
MVDVYFLNAKYRFSNGSQRMIKDAILDYCRETPSSISVCDMTIGVEGVNCGKSLIGTVLSPSNMIIGFDHELFPANTESMLDSLHILLAQTSFRMARSKHVRDGVFFGDQLVSYGLAQRFSTSLGLASPSLPEKGFIEKQLDETKPTLTDLATCRVLYPRIVNEKTCSALNIADRSDVEGPSMEYFFSRMGSHIVGSWLQEKDFDVDAALRVKAKDVLRAWRRSVNAEKPWKVNVRLPMPPRLLWADGASLPPPVSLSRERAAVPHTPAFMQHQSLHLSYSV